MNNKLMKNAFFNGFYKLLSVFFPLITVSYASRILGADSIGTIASSQNFITYFTMFASLGIPSYGVRAISKIKDNKEASSNAFFELLIINFISTTMCIIAYFILIQINFLNLNLQISLIFSSVLILNYLNIDWFYQANEKYSFIAFRSLIIKIISLVLLFIFVRRKEDIYWYVIILCFGTIGNFILNVINLRKFIVFKRYKINLAIHIKPIMIFFAAVVAVELYSLIDVTMLTNKCEAEVVGYYSNSAKIIKTFAGTITALGATLLPRLSYYLAVNDIQQMKKAVKKMFELILFLGIPSVIGIIILSKNIILILFGSEFEQSIPTCQILSLLILLMPLSGGIAAQILQTLNYEFKYLICVILGAAANIILNYFLINLYQHNGAALASIITECLVTLSMMLWANKYIPIRTTFMFILQIITSSAVMIGVIFLVKYFNFSLLLELIFSISFGAISYFVVMTITKNEFAWSILNCIKDKFSRKI